MIATPPRDRIAAGLASGSHVRAANWHRAQACADRRQVLPHQLQHVVVAENLVLARRTLQGADLFDQQPVIFGRSDTCEYERLALFGEPVEVDQGPDDGDEQGQADEPESDENQVVQ